MNNDVSFAKEAKTNTVKFNQVGDFITGTLIGVSKMTRPDKYGKYSTVFTVKAKEGKFIGSTKNAKTGKTELDKEETVIDPGQEYTVFAETKSVFETRLKSVKIGQLFKVEFTEIKPTTKGNDAKIKTVYPGLTKKGEPAMDTEWLDEKAKQEKLNADEFAGYDKKPDDDITADDVDMG